MKKTPRNPAAARKIVEMENVSSMECYSFPDGGTRRVLSGASLLVMRGEAWGITCDEPFEMALLMEIMGNVKPYGGGRCSLSQMGMMRSKRRALDHVLYINDQKLMYPHMHTLSWLMFASQRTPGAAAARQAQWLELLLEVDLYYLALTYARFLSAAEQAVVTALLALKMSRVQLVLIDLSNVDVPEALFAPLEQIIKRLRAQGRSVVLASARRDLIQRCCGHAAFLLDGGLQKQGEVEALCRQYDARRLVVRTGAEKEAADALGAAFPKRRIEVQGGEVWLMPGEQAEIAEAAQALARSGAAFDGIYIPDPSLERAFQEASM